VQHEAHEAAVPAVGAQSPLDVLLNRHVGFAEVRIERNLADALLIRRKIVGDIFERDEDGRTHQELTEEKRRGSRDTRAFT
jgi:hypothetical protein